jgi:hypothetical protein
MPLTPVESMSVNPIIPEAGELQVQQSAAREEGGLTVSQFDHPLRAPVQSSGVQLQAPGQLLDTDAQGELDRVLQAAHQSPEVIRKIVSLMPPMARLFSGHASPEDFDIELALLTTDIGTAQKELKLKEIERSRELHFVTMDEHQSKIKESLKAVTEAQKSGLAAKIFGWFSAIASIIVGAIMCATGVGATAGAMMIAAGVIGVVSCALQQAAKDGLISNEIMAVLGPVLTAVEVAIAVITAVVTFGGAAAGAIAKLAAKAGRSAVEMLATKVASLAGKVTDVASKSLTHAVKLGAEASQLGVSVGAGVTQAVNQGMQVNTMFKQAETMRSRAELNAINAVMERLTADLHRVLDTFNQVMAQIFQMLNAKSKSLHYLSSRNATI